MYDGLLEAYGQVVWLSNKKILTPDFWPCQGVKTPQNAPFQGKNVKKQGDNAPKNAPDLIYDGLLEAYGQVVRLSNRKKFWPPIFALARG